MIEYPKRFTFISDEVSQDLPTVVAFALRHGFVGFELRSMFGRAFRDLTRFDLGEIKRATQHARLTVVACATPVFKCRLDSESEIAAHRDIFCRSLEVAQQLGSRIVRVFTFLRGSSPASDADLSRSAAELRRLRVLADEVSVVVGIENEASCLVGTADETNRFLNASGDPTIGIIWDPCNALYVSGAGADATAGFAAIASRVIHVHMKDACRNGSLLESCELGMGEMDWRRHLHDLDSVGYSGMLSLETHWRLKTLHPEELHLPGGFAFSVGGEEASERCLKRIREILKYE